ncbi:hypothetical protein TNCV_912251 [Trichonephila clavipes]|nr:hypothetical protein TNCV_912251 [Trichonephila clavipes]
MARILRNPGLPIPTLYRDTLSAFDTSLVLHIFILGRGRMRKSALRAPSITNPRLRPLVAAGSTYCDRPLPRRVRPLMERSSHDLSKIFWDAFAEVAQKSFLEEN